MSKPLEILLVEDNDDHAHHAERSLSKSEKDSFNVTRLKDGQEAIDYLLNPENKPDVVLLDNTLPLKTGFEIMQETADKGKDFAYIFLTADSSIKTAVKAMKAGALDFLPKTDGYNGLPDMINKVYKIHRTKLEKIKAEEENKQLEEQLFRAQKMESVGRLAGGIAHDFNNVLTSIMGYAEIMQLKYEGVSTSETKSLDIILKNVGRAAVLTGQLLTFSRKSESNFAPLIINQIIKDTIKITEKIFEKNINVKYDFEKNICVIEADKNQLDQIITNLTINAKHAMPDGGDIIFKTENVFLDKEYENKYVNFKPGHYVALSITDTGTGMPKEVKEKIFEPFFTTKEEGKGTGLGLATVYGIIKKHKGYINVYSEPGEGTTFNLYFPVSEKEVIEKKIRKKSSIKGNGETIFIVDDEEDIREPTETHLRRLGYKSIVASDGVEAIDIYREKKNEIDLVLLDIQMPRKGGLETCLELRELNPSVKIIVTSGDSPDKNKIKKILSLNENYKFVQKPYITSDLLETIYETLKLKK